ncbi:hypothetical protein HZA97_07530 [Candidatus Woesearchaeota archaeon]|nr:hypothetical protein [Candidatus Woesearchaeota archaeon]
MSLEENLVKRIGEVVKCGVLSDSLRVSLLRILSKDDPQLLDEKAHCLFWKREKTVVPSNFEYLSGNFYLADITYEELVSLVEKNEYISIEKTRIYLDPNPMPELYTRQ